jgi:hypothetical protein
MQLPEPEARFDAIGRVVFMAAHLEMSLEQLLISLLNTPPAVQLARGQSFAMLIQSCKAALQGATIEERLRTAVADALSNAAMINQKRDHVVHGRGWAHVSRPSVRAEEPHVEWFVLRARRFKAEYYYSRGFTAGRGANPMSDDDAHSRCHST